MARISGSETFRPDDLVDLADQIEETFPKLETFRVGTLDGNLTNAATALPLVRINDIHSIGTLDGDLTNAATGVELNANSPITIAANMRIVIDDEVMHISAVTDQHTFTVTRGAQGTTAAAHSDNVQVFLQVPQRTIGNDDFILIDSEFMDVTASTNQYELTVTRAAKSTTAAAHTDGAEATQEVSVKTTGVVVGAGMRGRPSDGNIVGVVTFVPEDSSTAFTADLEISPDRENWVVNESYDQSNLVDSVDVAANMYHRINVKTLTANKTLGVYFNV